MQISNLISLTSLYLLANVLAKQQDQLPVCVIGAGPSGITMARKLKANNINYRIFESESRVGGKAYTWRDAENFPVEMGAFFFLKRDDGINKAVQEAGLELGWFNGTSIAIYNQNGQYKKLPVGTEEEIAQFIDAANRYSDLRDSYDLTVGYLNTPVEAQVSLSQWLTNNNLNALRSFFIPNVVIQGYGSLEDIPAIYIIRAFDIRGLSSFQQLGYLMWYVPAGLDKLWGNLSKDLNLSLNHKVRTVSRTKSNKENQPIRLYFENRDLPPANCSHVVMAFPPYLDKIKSMVTDLDYQEKQLFAKFKINYYGTSIIEMRNENWTSGGIFNTLSDDDKYPYEPIGKGETVGFLKQGKYYSAYSWTRGDYQVPVPKSVLTKFKSEQNTLLNQIDRANDIKSKVVFNKCFEYFPRVTVNDIKLGFFEKFDKLQGHKNTFYATSALSFETMNESILMAQALFENKVLPQAKASNLIKSVEGPVFVDQTSNNNV